ncbi:MAG: interferon-related developmental regulator-domain-containing protein [Piptocephalis tieghemiana]|nr:MAG: interferon-related developmental regulator-domain-containing protein [Piptocephalis tieghemiana]
MVLCRRYTASVLESTQETLVDSLKRCIQRSKTQKEGIRAAQALSVVYITLGPDLGMYDDLSLPLKYQISHAKKPDFQKALITTLSMMCYVAGEGVVETQDLLAFLMGLAQAGPRELEASVLATVLTSWGFLLTSLEGEGGSLRDSSWVEGALESHRSWLEHPSTEVRIAAGENIALILEMATMIEEEDDDDEGGVEGWARGLDVVQDILPILHNLTKESAKYRAKKERSKQKSAFREILEMVEEGQPPSERQITFHGTVYPVDSWIKGKRLQVFRSILGEGLTVHVRENELVLQMLGLNDEGDGTLLPSGHASGLTSGEGGAGTGAHQRVIHAPGSEVAKARSRSRRKERHIRGAKVGLGNMGDGGEVDDVY